MEDYELNNLLHPINLFKTFGEFKTFIYICEDINEEQYIEALQVLNELCIESELYEYCSEIQKIIYDKKTI